MSNQRLLALGLIGLSACAMYVFSQLAATVMAAVGVTDEELFGGLTLSTILGVALGLAAGVVAWMNARVQEVGQEVAGELRKVTWPTWPEIRAATVAVVVFSVVAAVIFGLYDFLASKVMIEWIPAGIRWAQGLFA